jgi:hypothetical protein
MSTTFEGVNYGPLACLIGDWQGDRGLDISPDEDEGIERNPFSEKISFVAAGDVTNANDQVLAIIRYHQVVIRKSTQKQFHDQIGYWTWDSASGVVTHSLTIPRACALLAGGSADINAEKTIFSVKAGIDNKDYTIAQSNYLFEKATTTSFEMLLEVEGDMMSYRQSTMLEIYGKTFDHRDKSWLEKV